MQPFFRLLLLGVAVFVAAGCALNADKQTEAEALVANARWTVESFKRREDQSTELFKANLEKAEGVIIFPNVTKGAFFVGAEGGSGVLLMRNDDGSWGYPAFYTLGGGSLGLQLGGQSSQVVLLLRSKKAVNAIIDYQGKLGGDVQVTIGDLGSGLEASTTTNFGADIVGFAHAQGVFMGFSLEGAVIGRRSDLNSAYYGVGRATPDEIIKQRKHWNTQADPLRQALLSSPAASSHQLSALVR